MPSSGYGNFMEIGPLDINLEKRNYSPIQDFNVLFIDNPVGVGYSYVVGNDTKTPKNNEEIGGDLFRFLKIFMNRKEDFQNVPLYIFGESYGGKMVVEFACQIAKVNCFAIFFNQAPFYIKKKTQKVLKIFIIVTPAPSPEITNFNFLKSIFNY